MLKRDLERDAIKMREKLSIIRSALERVRQNARECIKKSKNGQPHSINNVWAIELVTEAIAKSDSVK